MTKNWSIHLYVLLMFMVLSIFLTWPMILHFTNAVIGVDDALHFVWVLWHTKQAVLFHEPFFSTRLLYYPQGATLLTTAVGPMMGLFALPFWHWGPAAAYNGSLLIGFILTGYCMYLLARSLGFDIVVSFFAGVILIVSPMHLIATYGHLSKIFIGGIPLTLLALHYSLDLKRSHWWTLGTGAGLLVTLLTSGEQFVFTSLAVGFFILVRLITTGRDDRLAIIKRCLQIALFCLLSTGWLAFKTFLVTRNPALLINTSAGASQHQPDLIQFFIPSDFYNRFWGPIFARYLSKYDVSPLETDVYLFWTGLILCLVGLVKSSKPIRQWLGLLCLCVVFALGPDLKILGLHHVTGARYFVRMPYFYLTHLPGFSFLRTPGRFMLLGSVGFGISASFGLAWLRQRLKTSLGLLISVLAIGLVLFESWPSLWPQTKLWPVPEFYKQIAHDSQQYGIFDLPIRPQQEINYYSSYVIYSINYQIYQMTHGKGIASGYIDRWFIRHPLFSWFVSNTSTPTPIQPDFMVNGEPTNFYADVRYELARKGYRYVVYHKPIKGYTPYQKNSWGEETSLEFIKNVFGSQEPLVDDGLVTVYEVGNVSDAEEQITSTIAPMLTDDDSWRAFTTGQHWLTSPAPLYIASDQLAQASLEIKIQEVSNTCSGGDISNGVAILETGNGTLTTSNFNINQTLRLPISLSRGSEVVELKLTDGISQDKPSCFIFSVKYLNLQFGTASSVQPEVDASVSDP